MTLAQEAADRPGTVNVPRTRVGQVLLRRGPFLWRTEIGTLECAGVAGQRCARSSVDQQWLLPECSLSFGPPRHSKKKCPCFCTQHRRLGIKVVPFRQARIRRIDEFEFAMERTRSRGEVRFVRTRDATHDADVERKVKKVWNSETEGHDDGRETRRVVAPTSTDGVAAALDDEEHEEKRKETFRVRLLPRTRTCAMELRKKRTSATIPEEEIAGKGSKHRTCQQGRTNRRGSRVDRPRCA